MFFLFDKNNEKHCKQDRSDHRNKHDTEVKTVHNVMRRSLERSRQIEHYLVKGYVVPYRKKPCQAKAQKSPDSEDQHRQDNACGSRSSGSFFRPLFPFINSVFHSRIILLFVHLIVKKTYFLLLLF